MTKGADISYLMPSQELLHVSLKFVLVQCPFVVQTVKETLNSLSVNKCKRILKEKRVLNHATDHCLTGVGKMVQDINLVCVPAPDIQHFLTLYSILKKQESHLWFCRLLKMMFGLTVCAIFLYMLRRKPRRRVRKFRHIQELFRIMQSVRVQTRLVSEDID
ncbi:mitochondrial ubiquitin ligase activator of nfkb 1-like [Carassius auratus]|uniref:Mitochondrial ubiquitin ligase activator of nfkb 1-like n=1 Tax=Carassius auratus TaxID=7957 RepID=A0A6P6MW39_CARAU|nr:mitochondrial ubiquitin ligase activator of nfkb 1-like [Carassius auratus]